MAWVARQTLPRIVERGVAQTLTRDVESTAGAQQTATAGSLTITLGGSTLVDAADLSSSLGPPASYSLLAATTTDESLSEGWLEKWSLTLSSRVETFLVRGFLVRHAYYATFTDDDITARYYSLDSLQEASETFENKRIAAAEYIERRLLRQGRRPWLIFDSWQLHDAAIALCGHFIFRDWASSVGDGRYRQEAADCWADFEREWDTVKFAYDLDQDGTVNDEELEGGRGPLVLTAGNTWSGVA